MAVIMRRCRTARRQVVAVERSPSGILAVQLFLQLSGPRVKLDRVYPEPKL